MIYKVTSAKLNVFTEFENTCGMDNRPSDGINEYFNEMGGLKEEEAIQMEMVPTSTAVITHITCHCYLFWKLQESAQTAHHPLTSRPSNVMEGACCKAEGNITTAPELERLLGGTDMVELSAMMDLEVSDIVLLSRQEDVVKQLTSKYYN